MGKITLGIAALMMTAAPVAASAAEPPAPRTGTTIRGQAIGGEYGLVISVVLLVALVAGIAIAAGGGGDDDVPVSP